MKKVIEATIEDGPRTWLVVSMAFDAGDQWAAPVVGTQHADEGFTDASDHFGVYVGGEFDTRYPGMAPVRVSGFSLSPIRELTGDKAKYPSGDMTVDCVEPGVLLWVVPRGEEVALDYVVLEPGESVELPVNGWALKFEDYVPHPVGGTLTAVDTRTLAFWVKP